MLRRRNFNIDSIAVGLSAQANLSRMTIVVEGDDVKVEQVRKQLDKVVEVVKIVDISDYDKVEREIALVKVKATPTTRSEIIQITEIFRANIIDVSSDSLIIEVTGDKEKVDSFLELLKGFGVREISRTGCIALTRGGAGPLLVDEDKLTRKKEKKVSRHVKGAAPNW